MSKLIHHGELYRAGLMTNVEVLEHEYDVIEVTFRKNLKTADGTKDILNSKYQMFFTHREFEEFFNPFIMNVKEKIENDRTNP
jgi:hypothetical protein